MAKSSALVGCKLNDQMNELSIFVTIPMNNHNLRMCPIVDGNYINDMF